MKKSKIQKDLRQHIFDEERKENEVDSFLVNKKESDAYLKKKIEIIYNLIYPEMSYDTIKFQSNYYSIGDLLIIYDQKENLIGELLRIIPNHGIKSNPYWPTIEVQWLYKKTDINLKKNNLLVQKNYNSISDYELFPTNHKDIIFIEAILGKCEVYSYEDYENLEEHTENTFFSRAKYGLLTETLIPKFDSWKKGCVCDCPLNPDQLYIKCDSCSGWFHPECCGIDEDQVDNIASFYCPSCQSENY